MVGIPTLYLSNQQANARNDPNEIRVSAGHHRLVVDNYFVSPSPAAAALPASAAAWARSIFLWRAVGGGGSGSGSGRSFGGSTDMATSAGFRPPDFIQSGSRPRRLFMALFHAGVRCRCTRRLARSRSSSGMPGAVIGSSGAASDIGNPQCWREAAALVEAVHPRVLPAALSHRCVTAAAAAAAAVPRSLLEPIAGCMAHHARFADLELLLGLAIKRDVELAFRHVGYGVR